MVHTLKNKCVAGDYIKLAEKCWPDDDANKLQAAQEEHFKKNTPKINWYEITNKYRTGIRKFNNIVGKYLPIFLSSGGQGKYQLSSIPNYVHVEIGPYDVFVPKELQNSYLELLPPKLLGDW